MLLKHATYKIHSIHTFCMSSTIIPDKKHLRKPYIRIYKFLILYNYVPTMQKLRCDDLRTIITQPYFCTSAHSFYFSMNEFLQIWYAMYRRLTSLRHQILLA